MLWHDDNMMTWGGKWYAPKCLIPYIHYCYVGAEFWICLAFMKGKINGISVQWSFLRKRTHTTTCWGLTIPLKSESLFDMSSTDSILNTIFVGCRGMCWWTVGERLFHCEGHSVTNRRVQFQVRCDLWFSFHSWDETGMKLADLWNTFEIAFCEKKAAVRACSNS